MKRLGMTAVLVLGLGTVASADKPADKAGGKPAAAAAAPADANVATHDCGAMMKAVMPLPTKMGELMTAIADGMEGHAAWVAGSKDKAAKAEASAFKKLAKDHRDVAKSMKKIVAHMEDGAKLAPSPHDMSKMDPKMGETMMKQIALEREMAAMMIKHADESEKMMKGMAHAGHAGHAAPAAAAAKK